MMWIIIALVLTTIGGLVYKFLSEVPGVCIIVLAFLCVFPTLDCYIGYETPVMVEEFELKPIAEGTNVYVVQSEDENKIYKYEVTNEFDETLKNTVIKRMGRDARIEYVEEGLKPVFRKYKKKLVESIWNGILVEDKIETVIFVPESCVVK